MHQALIWYKDIGGGEGYAILAMLSASTTEASMTALDPLRFVSIRVDQMVEGEHLLDISKPCQRNWAQVVELVKGMPDTLEQLKVLDTVAHI